ncbi:MAG: hypothetical protein L3J74_02135 [Bacteroidales bacterium]|nr:hypothetical protein [Bacteroidales bacterium]
MKRISWIIFLLLFSLAINAQLKRVLVTETTLKINAKDSSVLYFGFDKGDKVLISVEMKKGRKLRQVELFEYPDIQIFMEYKTKDIYAKRIKITHRGIYKLKFTNKSIFSRILNLKIERIPEGKNTDFNTTVYWKTYSDTIFNIIEKEIEIKKYEVQTIVPLSVYYINSGSNATFLGGKSRITFPVNLPKNTIEWYYQFSAAKNQDEIELSNLTKQLSGIVSDSETIDINTDNLIQPYGRVYCDVYLLDEQNSFLFERKKSYRYIPEGSRRNSKAGIVKLPFENTTEYYIGIRNPASIKGINVNFEAAAIIQKIEKKYEKVKDPNHYRVNTKKVPYLKQSETDSK